MYPVNDNHLFRDRIRRFKLSPIYDHGYGLYYDPASGFYVRACLCERHRHKHGCEWCHPQSVHDRISGNKEQR